MRDLRTIPTATLDPAGAAPQLSQFLFLKMIWPAPIGTLRWTTYPADSYALDAHDGAGSQTWDGTAVWTPMSTEQGVQTQTAINGLVLYDDDEGTWAERLRTHRGGIGIPVMLFRAVFNVTTGALIDTLCDFAGIWEAAAVRKNGEIEVSLAPAPNLYGQRFPRGCFTASWGFKWIPKANSKYKWGGSQVQPNATPSAFTNAPSTFRDPALVFWQPRPMFAVGELPPRVVAGVDLASLVQPPPPQSGPANRPGPGPVSDTLPPITGPDYPPPPGK